MENGRGRGERGSCSAGSGCLTVRSGCRKRPGRDGSRFAHIGTWMCSTWGIRTLAMEIFRVSARFPKEERYSLTDQIRRSSRSVCSNIVEGFAKRRHEAVFKNSLNNSLGESEETRLWLNFALDCGYLSAEDHERLTTGYNQVGAMLWTLMIKWQKFD